jgi:predicted RNA binding protein YcfA (HicA-like mRNA interferase family)
MTLIRTMVPLNMYRVTYELAYGRPYSKLEELLLKAINEATDSGGRTSRELGKIFKVHVRLLTEALVTLIQEGWVAMEQKGSEIYYLVTEEGRSTVASGRRPRNLRVRTAHATIVRERLTGQMARASELTLTTANVLRRSAHRAVRKEALQPRVIRTKINGGEAERLLRRSDQRQEWVRWIDSAARVSQDLHYLPIRVDLDSGKVFGLPYQWQHLTAMIVEESLERREEFEADPEFQSELQKLMQRSTEKGLESGDEEASTAARWAEPYAQTYATCADLTLNGGQGRAVAEDLLARAEGSVLIVAGHLDESTAAATKDAAIALRRRGVNCDVLWSCEEEEAADTILRRMTAIRADDSLPGKVQFNRAPAVTVADMIITVTADGPVAAIGAGLFGGADRDDELRPALRLTDPGVVASLARVCAGWWDELPAEEGALPTHRWKHLAEQWAGEAAAAQASGETPVGISCPDDPTAECKGTVVVLVGPQQSAFRANLAVEAGRRYLRTDPSGSADRAVAQLNELPDTVGRLYRVVGGAEGWRALRRKASTWAIENVEAPPPARSQRLLAVNGQWLVECGDPARSSISFCVEGHVGERAWIRTALK